eukprot:TRINITY_DN1053_c0_g1_i6.p2 TRINITY_DN1053_c0_g1~~TRINITY_DN1053_c0_g1_i6.p2  ORF type:complete len:1108 (-),score=520.22 TRINITY_DN1053_c0_g1_i6:1374-4697(-)
MNETNKKRMSQTDSSSPFNPLEDILKHPASLYFFQEYLKSIDQEHYIKFWSACNKLANMKNKFKLMDESKSVYDKFIKDADKVVELADDVMFDLRRGHVEPDKETWTKPQADVLRVMKERFFDDFEDSGFYCAYLHQLDVDDSEISGTLQKMGEKGLKGWKTRWFKCQGVELHYYKSEGKKDSQGFIDLKDVIRVQLHNDEVPFPDKKHAGCGFQIETEKRIYNLSAETPLERLVWIKKLKRKLGEVASEVDGALAANEMGSRGRAARTGSISINSLRSTGGSSNFGKDSSLRSEKKKIILNDEEEEEKTVAQDPREQEEKKRKEQEEKERKEKEEQERKRKEEEEERERLRLKAEQEKKEQEEKERKEKEEQERKLEEEEEERERLRLKAEQEKKEQEEKERREREEQELKERLQKEKEEKERKEREQREKEERERKEKEERERKEREQKEKEEQEERERKEREQKEQEERERKEKEEEERRERERKEKEERERQEREQKEKEERERKEREEKEREEERLRKQREEEEKLRIRLEKEKQEEAERQARLQKEREEKERQEREQREQEERERIAREKEEEERKRKEQLAKEEQMRLEAEQRGKEELARYEQEKIERELKAKQELEEKEKKDREEKERKEREEKERKEREEKERKEREEKERKAKQEEEERKRKQKLEQERQAAAKLKAEQEEREKKEREAQQERERVEKQKKQEQQEQRERELQEKRELEKKEQEKQQEQQEEEEDVQEPEEQKGVSPKTVQELQQVFLQQPGSQGTEVTLGGVGSFVLSANGSMEWNWDLADSVDSLTKQMETINQEKQAAVQSEDYVRAATCKTRIDELQARVDNGDMKVCCLPDGTYLAVVSDEWKTVRIGTDEQVDSVSVGWSNTASSSSSESEPESEPESESESTSSSSSAWLGDDESLMEKLATEIPEAERETMQPLVQDLFKYKLLLSMQVDDSPATELEVVSFTSRGVDIYDKKLVLARHTFVTMILKIVVTLMADGVKDRSNKFWGSKTTVWDTMKESPIYSMPGVSKVIVGLDNSQFSSFAGWQQPLLRTALLFAEGLNRGELYSWVRSCLVDVDHMNNSYTSNAWLFDNRNGKALGM